MFPIDLTTKSSLTQVADTDVLSNQSRRRIKTGKREENHKRAGGKDVLWWP